ncbi:WAR1 [[Candida] subhashii]|uniref:WAR1 n=1 Tax=[Candida] subhashii TaxID=561895 RepID=A0A8J5UER9_9ASCO|nr:WAR1 [[Candida] subhashii]KAG7661413.1 WAR1 [[Candida] subhashii]
MSFPPGSINSESVKEIADPTSSPISKSTTTYNPNRQQTSNESDSPTPTETPTPSSTTTGTKKSKSTRRSVACKSCHTLKVKCTPSDPDNPAGSCIRCLNAKRKCEIDLTQTRKRRKKADILEANAQAAAGSTLTSTNTDSRPASRAATTPVLGYAGPPQAQPLSTVMSRGGMISVNDSLANSSIPSPRFTTITPVQRLFTSGSPVSAPAVIPPVLPTVPLVETVPQQPSQPDEKDNEILLLKQKVKTLESQLAQRMNFQHTHKRTNSTQSTNDTVSDVSSPPFISKFDLEREITILVESSNSKLTDITSELNALADRRTRLLKEGNSAIDMVSAGLVSPQEAAERVKIYKEQIFALNPLVDIPDNLSIDEFRTQQPFLFNAIMSVTNTLYVDKSESAADRGLMIDNEAIRTVSVEVMVAGTKSDELIKSCLVLCLWYNSPELFRQRRYHLLNTICVSLLHDLGILSRSTYLYNNGVGSVTEKVDPNKGNNEYRALILTIYFTSISICLILRRRIYVRWTPYVEECCCVLEKSSEERYRKLALFSRLNHMLDKIHHIIHAPDTAEKRTSTSSYIIQELQKSLTVIRHQIKDDDHANLAYYFSVEAYLHEPCLADVFTRDSDEEGGDGENLEGGVKLDPKAVRSIANCTNSCLNALDEFNQLTSIEVASSPLFHGTRIIYTAGMLLRLRYLIMSLPSLIEKDLVPQHAVTAIQRTNRLIEQANQSHPSNHFLKKTRLVLQLFIQTYAAQVQDLLKKNNGDTPQNLRPLESSDRHSHHHKQTKNSSLAASDDAEKYSIPLDILSYAASVRRESKNAQKRSNSETGMKEFVPPPTFASAGNTPVTGLPPPPQSQSMSTQQSPSQQARQVAVRVTDQQQQQPQPPNGQFNPPMQQHHPQQTQHMSHLSFNGTTPQFTPPPAMHFTNEMYRLPSIPGSVSNGPIGGVPMGRFNPNLAQPDHLESSYMHLNDEFWADLLSTDDATDGINFSNNNTNIGQLRDEVFFN